jgi:hypothetical protein
VRGSGLPPTLADAVLAVTGKTRLWPWERTDVARELCGHFLDGLEAGATPEELRASFGDPRATAKLITRAKKRNRPIAWRAMKRTVQAVGLLLALLVVWYLWNVARYYSGSPTIKINLQAEINTPSLAVPLEQRGWPLYRDAARELHAASFSVTVGQIDGWPNVKPGTEQWAAACKAVDAVGPALEKIKRATAMARSAFVVDTKAVPTGDRPIPDGERADPRANPIGMGILLPQLSIYRQHARLLSFDLLRAAWEGRADDATRTVESLLTLSRHASEDGTLIGQLVSVAIAHLAFDTLNTAVRDYPALFSDDQLRRLAHRVGSFSPGPDDTAKPWQADLRVERREFEDLLQRFFTDDGQGDGRLCDGMRYYSDEFGAVRPRAEKLLNPVLAGVVAGRKETHDLFNRLLDRHETENAKPLYERDRRAVDREIDEALGSLGIRNSLAALMVRSLSHSGRPFDVGRTLRDATAAGLAVELYKRKTGSFPSSWSDLTPGMLPSAPIDPWSGRALGFKPGAGQGGRPLIYSVGADKTDNGGTIGTPWDVISAWSSPMIHGFNGMTGTGDWVIWPKPEPTGERPQAGPVGGMLGGAPERRPAYQWGWVGSLLGGGY